MPIGTSTPGEPTTILPDANPTRYGQFQGPAPDGFATASDLYQVILLALNVQIPFGSVATMQARTSAATGDPYLAFPFGLYYYDSGATVSNPPNSYAATGIGSGAWVWTSWKHTFETLASTKLKDSILPYFTAVKSETINTGAHIEFALTSATDVLLTNSASDSLEVSISGVATGDRIHMRAGPFGAVLGTPDSAYMAIVVSQNGVIHAYQKQRSTSGEFSFDFEYISNSAENIQVDFAVKNNGIASSTIYLGAGNIPQWGGPTSFQYLSYDVMRSF